MLASSQGAGEQGDVPAGGTTPAQGNSAVPAKSRLPVRYFSLERLHLLFFFSPFPNTLSGLRLHHSLPNTTKQRLQHGVRNSAAGGCRLKRAAVSLHTQWHRWCCRRVLWALASGCWTPQLRHFKLPDCPRKTHRLSCCDSADSGSSVPQWASRASFVHAHPSTSLQRSKRTHNQQHNNHSRHHRKRLQLNKNQQNQQKWRRKKHRKHKKQKKHKKKKKRKRHERRGCGTVRRGRS